MKKVYLNLGFMLLALAFFAQVAGAQVRYVDVEPGLGTLNDAITGDTTETGDRVDPENTVFRLQRGLTAYYGLEGSIENRDPLTIEAVEGDGPRPFLEPRVVGDASARPFRARADITLKGIHTSGFDNLGGLTDLRMIRASADDIHITVDDCWFDGDGQSFIRCDNPGMKIVVTNSVISRVGQPSSPDNGRGIDDRGNDIDTVIFENCTFYDITSRIIRDGGGKIGYAKFANNTVFNVGQMGITFGAAEKAEVMNNLFVNTGFMPLTVSGGDRYIFGVDSIQLDSVTMQAPEITWMNNLIYFDSTQVAGYLNDTIVMPMLMNPGLAAWYMEKYGTTPQVGEMLTFNDQPPFADSVIIYDLYPEFDRNNSPGWMVPDVPADPEGNGLYHAVVPYDFGYTNTVAAVMRGDMNWEAAVEDFTMVDFERPWERQVWNIFGDDDDAFMSMEVVPNPDKSGDNTSDYVMKFIAKAAGQSWAGAYSDAYGPMTFTQEMHHMTMQVWKDKIGDSGLKVEQGGTTTELKVPNTVSDQWETLTFDFSANIGETLTRVVFFPDFVDRDADVTAYVDNIQMIESPVGVEKEQATGLRVYPNPASTQLTIEYAGMQQILVRDVLGKLVQRVELQGQDQFNLPVEHLTGGVYFVTVEGAGNSFTTKFLKK